MRGASWRVLAAGVCLPLLITACPKKGSGPSTSGTPTPISTSAAAVAPSHDSPAGAMAGLLGAMKAGDNTQVLEWISPDPPADRTSLTGAIRLQGSLGLGELFWEVDNLHIGTVTEKGAEAADVALDGFIVWCGGSGPTDPSASCAQPNGSGDTQTMTYPAVRVSGQWYIHLDLNHGQLVHGNPALGGASSEPSATDSSTTEPSSESPTPEPTDSTPSETAAP